jgi:enoyl-[acyl-carrier protein] reductase III
MNESAANDTLSQVRERGSDGFLIRADVRQPQDIRRMCERVRSEFGSLDFFVSNARPEIPAFYQAPFEITLEQWQAAIDSQARAFLLAVRELAPMMGSGGRIIAITYAPGGQKGSWQPWVAMGSAKAAMESLCRYFAVALARRGITVNALSPGWIDDSVLNTLPQQAQDSIRQWNERGWTPMGRIGTPADIGNAVALLCSEEAGWITGQTIAVDGGASIMDPCLPLEIQLPAAAPATAVA